MAFEDTPGTAGRNFPPETPQPETPQPAPQPKAPERRDVTVRRAPRYVPFLILGGLLGVGVAAAVAFGVQGDGSYDPNAIFGFFLILFGAGGVVVGAVAALLLDRLSVRRAQHAVVEAVPENETAAGNGGATGAGTDSDADGRPDRKS